MATQSFFQDMILDTPEKIRRLEEAYDEADRRGPIDTTGAKPICRDKEFIMKVQKRLIEQ